MTSSSTGHIFSHLTELKRTGSYIARGAAILCLILLAFGASSASGAVSIGGNIHQGIESQPEEFDHGAFDRLLHQNVRSGLVDYDGFAASPEFPRYLASLARANPDRMPREEQLAFWINAYNAYTIQLIIKHHERESIRNINRSFGFVKGHGPWTEKLAVVSGHAYGLDEIENDIIRPRFHEPRIHFAIVCASIGCPSLRSEAYAGVHLDAQLDDQARLFLLRSPLKNSVDVKSRIVRVSPIFINFSNYINDFGGSERAVGRFIGKYYPEGRERELLLSGSFKMVQTKYDWSLNSEHRS